MNRLASLFLIFSFLFTATGFRQFLKLPLLLEHYSEHRSKVPQLSFIHFLYIHYVGDDADPTDDSREKALPFKGSPDGASIQQMTAGASVSCDADINQQIPTTPHFFDNKRLSAYLPPIWQPPRTV